MAYSSLLFLSLFERDRLDGSDSWVGFACLALSIEKNRNCILSYTKLFYAIVTCNRFLVFVELSMGCFVDSLNTLLLKVVAIHLL